ncbi:MAG: PmoA family protein [Planctomycetota bacterium]
MDLFKYLTQWLATCLILAASQSVLADEDKEQLTLSDGDRPIATYNAGFVASPIEDAPWFGRSGFIHPVYSPKGRVVTDPFPADHPHQHGLMFAWTSSEYEGQRVDFWNSRKKQGKVEHVETIKADADTIKVTLRHVIIAGKHKDTIALNETWSIKRVEHDTLNIFDLVSVQTCATDKPLKIRQYKYGAMCIRGPANWSNGDAMLTSEGESQADGNHTRPSWVALFGEVGGETAGIAAMAHPDNFHGPQPVRLHEKMSYFCFAPMVAGEFYIKPGEPYVSRFRFLTYDGKPDADQLNAVWKDYTKDTE